MGVYVDSGRFLVLCYQCSCSDPTHLSSSYRRLPGGRFARTIRRLPGAFGPAEPMLNPPPGAPPTPGVVLLAPNPVEELTPPLEGCPKPNEPLPGGAVWGVAERPPNAMGGPGV